MDDFLEYMYGLFSNTGIEAPKMKLFPKYTDIQPKILEEPVAATTYVSTPQQHYTFKDPDEYEDIVGFKSLETPTYNPQEMFAANLDWNDPIYQKSLLDAQIYEESRWNPVAYNKKTGASGIAQFMPKTWQGAINRGWVPEGSSPFDEEYAMIAQRKYMEFLLERPYIAEITDPQEKLARALASYNAGYGNFKTAIKEAKAEGKYWLDKMSRETKNYVPLILERARNYSTGISMNT